MDNIQLLVRAINLITKLLLENKRIGEENYRLREKIKDHEGLEKLLVERDIFLNK